MGDRLRDFVDSCSLEDDIGLHPGRGSPRPRGRPKGTQENYNQTNDLKRTSSGLHQVQQQIRNEAKGESGVVKMDMGFDALNAILRAEDPMAFEPDIVQLHRRKQREREIEK